MSAEKKSRPRRIIVQMKTIGERSEKWINPGPIASGCHQKFRNTFRVTASNLPLEIS